MSGARLLSRESSDSRISWSEASGLSIGIGLAPLLQTAVSRQFGGPLRSGLGRPPPLVHCPPPVSLPVLTHPTVTVWM